jgi:hypothetical protein
VFVHKYDIYVAVKNVDLNKIKTSHEYDVEPAVISAHGIDLH